MDTVVIARSDAMANFNMKPIGTRMHILIVDDDANIRKTLFYCLSALGHTVISVASTTDAVAEARRSPLDIAFVDLRLGEADGMDLVSTLLTDSPWMKIIVITAYATIETAVEAIRRGATDYLPKPFDTHQIKFMLRRVGRIRELEVEVAALRQDMQRLDPQEQLRSRNAAMNRVIETAKKAAASDAIVLLCGESGTGKSVFARAIHHWSPRAVKPMAVVACPSMPAGLLESELFGHAKGAFTGAVRHHPGRVATCEGGTLFLDEISEVEPGVQAKLLRFIQDKEYERVGESATRKADVRIIAATNVDLEKRVLEGRFRDDLFYRLNVIRLVIPSLRERREDIAPLARDFLACFSHVNHKRILDFGQGALDMLESYAWPGNVRELRNVIERAVILGSGETIGIHDFPEMISPAEKIPEVGDKVPLSTIEELHIRRILARTASLQEAAEVLGIDPATLWRKRKSYGI